jgi:hypothetical protein
MFRSVGIRHAHGEEEMTPLCGKPDTQRSGFPFKISPPSFASGCSHHVIESVAHVATLIEENAADSPIGLGSS